MMKMRMVRPGPQLNRSRNANPVPQPRATMAPTIPKMKSHLTTSSTAALTVTATLRLMTSSGTPTLEPGAMKMTSCRIRGKNSLGCVALEMLLVVPVAETIRQKPTIDLNAFDLEHFHSLASVQSVYPICLRKCGSNDCAWAFTMSMSTLYMSGPLFNTCCIPHLVRIR